MSLFDRKPGGVRPEGEQGVRAASEQRALTRRGARSIAKAAAPLTVGALESALLREFPAEDAESWDRTGLVVGESALAVGKVAVALDPTVSAIREARARGADVLVTHHPPFLAAPDSFAPEASVAKSSGAGVWAAIQEHVALMCFHTALDVSPRVARVLPGMLGLSFTGRFVEPLASTKRKGYGQICQAAADAGEGETLARLAARCTAVFGRPPRVWGDLEAPMRTVVTATGSAGSLGRACVAAGADCLVCGEVKYHDALDLSQAGLAVIDLGHDVSELPLVAVLADAVAGAGVAPADVIVIDQTSNWTCPESTRL